MLDPHAGPGHVPPTSAFAGDSADRRVTAAKRVSARYLALDRVDVLIAAVFLSTLVSRGGLEGIWSRSDNWQPS